LNSFSWFSKDSKGVSGKPIKTKDMKVHFISEGTAFESSYKEQRANINRLAKEYTKKVISFGYWLVSFSFSIAFCVLMLNDKSHKSAYDLLLIFGVIIILVSMTKIATIFMDTACLEEELTAAKKKLREETEEFVKKNMVV
jgi:hypothetical protein